MKKKECPDPDCELVAGHTTPHHKRGVVSPFAGLFSWEGDDFSMPLYRRPKFHFYVPGPPGYKAPQWKVVGFTPAAEQPATSGEVTWTTLADLLGGKP